MKINYKFILGALSIFLSAQLSAQWSQKANFSGANRTYAAGFSIGDYGFIGCGANSPTGPTFYKDFYKWNQRTNTWSAIASYPGAGSLSCVSFAIEGKGYVGLGSTGAAVERDLWSYDTATNTWTKMDSIPSGFGRYDEAVFVIGHKAYVIGGSIAGHPYLQDVWMYDAHQNKWTQKNNSPAGQTDAGAAFAVGNHGYYGGGKDGFVGYSTYWEYDTTSDIWTSIAAFPTATAPTGNSRAFVIGSKAYVCTGTSGDASYTTDLPLGYAYDTNTHAWASFTNMGVAGIERGYSVAFTIGNSGYIGTGEDSLGTMLNTFWQWGPTSGAGIEDIHSSVNINLYPNPSNGMMNLVYNGTIQKGQLQIIDLTGRVLNSYEIKGSNGRTVINEASLSNGMYFYQVIDSGKLISSGKFIIAK